MNSKGHLFCSIFKSMFRIIGCLGALSSYLEPDAAVLWIGFTFLLAEVLGIIEEVMDKR